MAEGQRLLVVNASSAGYNGANEAKIMVNDELIQLEKNENGHFRGLHIVVINRQNGKIKEAKVFDTYKASEKFEEFIDHEVPGGHIVVAACKDDCMTNLSRKAKKWFKKMGSKEIGKIRYRCAFAFVGIVGVKEASEKRGSRQKEEVSLG